MSADFASEIADLVVARLLAAGVGAGVYTSKQLPPGCPSREAFNDRCRFIDGAYRDGKVWVCSVDAYRVAMLRGSRPKPEKRKAPPPKVDAAAILAQPKRAARGR